MKFVLYFAIGWCLVWGFADEAMAADGNWFLKNCQAFLSTPTDGLATGSCIGYVAGVRDNDLRWHALLEMVKLDLRVYCLPESPDGGQLIRVIVKYLEDNPAELHKSAALLIQPALHEAFPCPEAE